MGSNGDPLRRELAEMRAAMARQQTRIEQQQARIEQLEAVAPQPPAGPRRSRRQMLKLAGATLAGAAAGAAGIAGAATPAFAATGASLLVGQSKAWVPNNEADKATQLDYTDVVNVGAAFLATAGGGGEIGPTGSSFPSALAGWTLLEAMPNGIYGYTNATGGSGVVAFNGHTLPDGPNPGLHAESVRGYAGEFWIQANGKAQVFLKPSASAGAPAPAGHQNGELYVDSSGVLYYFRGGSFKPVMLAGQTSLVTMLTAPIRLLESRPLFEDPSAGQTKPHRPIGTGETWEVPITGQVMGGLSVPTGAKAAIGNVTVTNPIAAGYLTLFPHGATRPGTSSINYGPGATVANGVIVGLSSGGLVDFYASAQTDVIFDAAGYIV